MAIKNIIAQGIGFTPGSISFMPTLGFSIGSVTAHAAPGLQYTAPRGPMDYTAPRGPMDYTAPRDPMDYTARPD